MDCGIVVVTYNNAVDVAGILASLPAASAGLELRTVVVDNRSIDGTPEIVRSFPGVQCIETGANLGYAGAINVGRRCVQPCSALLVLNPDLRLEPGAIKTMYDALQELPKAGIAFPMVLDDDGELYPSLRREPSLSRALGDAMFGRRFPARPGWLSETVWTRRDYLRTHVVDWATGAAMLISARCDAAVGDWDERFFLYSEETDVAARARAHGFAAVYIPEARAQHRGGGSGRSDALTALMAVNRIRYYEKRHRRHAVALFRMMVVLHELLRAGGRAHRRALAAVLSRSRWALLPRADEAPRPSG